MRWWQYAQLIAILHDQVLADLALVDRDDEVLWSGELGIFLLQELDEVTDVRSLVNLYNYLWTSGPFLDARYELDLDDHLMTDLG